MNPPSVRECGAIAAVLHTRRPFGHSPLGQTILTFDSQTYSSVPTKDQILVPETLLKKRKSQEQARAARRAEAEKVKKVS